MVCAQGSDGWLAHDWFAIALDGHFTETVAIQALAQTVGDRGDVSDSYETITGLGAVPAIVVPVQTREGRTGPITVSIGTFNVLLDGHYSAVNNTCRAKWSGRTFDIRSFHHGPGSAFTAFTMEEVTA